MIRLRNWAAIVLLAIAIVPQYASSQMNNRIWEPTLLEDATDEIPKGTVSKEIVGQLQLSGLRIVLEETKMSDVAAKLGGTIGQRGDAADYLEWLCYEVPTSEGRSVLWLLSGEIDGETVGGFQWLSIAASRELDQRCQILPRGAVEIPLAIRPGIAEAALRSVLGKPTRQKGQRIEYVHEKELEIRKEPFTVTNTLSVLLRNSVVYCIEVWKSTVS